MPFKFVIDGQPLYIHADLVSRHSKPLDRLMNGHMAEAQQGFAVLEDVDAETFARFIQWAYSGFYSAPCFDLVVVGSSSVESKAEGDAGVDWAPSVYEDELTEEAMPLEEAPDLHSYSWGGFDRSTLASKKKGKNVYNNEPTNKHSSKGGLKDSFQKRKFTVRRESIVIPPPRSNQAPSEDYTNIFLSHARLHVFADKYDIESLKLLALEELQITLAKFTLYSERTGDIVELLRYIYANSGESVPGVEDLRTLTTHYVGYEMDMLMRDGNFKALMIEDGGPLLSDFMGMVGKRI